MANPNPVNKIDKDKRKELPSRGKGKKTLMLDAVRATCGSEAEFLERVVEVAIGGDDTPPNMQLMTLVLQRIEPPMKSTMPLVDFTFDSNLKPNDQASQVLQAASEGKIAPDVANIFISSIASMLKIDEVTELQKRLEAIEDSLGVNNG